MEICEVEGMKEERGGVYMRGWKSKGRFCEVKGWRDVQKLTPLSSGRQMLPQMTPVYKSLVMN